MGSLTWRGDACWHVAALRLLVELSIGAKLASMGNSKAVADIDCLIRKSVVIRPRLKVSLSLLCLYTELFLYIWFIISHEVRSRARLTSTKTQLLKLPG